MREMMRSNGEAEREEVMEPGGTVEDAGCREPR